MTPAGSQEGAAGLLVAAASLIALGVAYYAQDFMALGPCPLCLAERWPYRLAAALGLLAIIGHGRLRRLLLVLAAVALAVDTAIAFLHVGVERHWWPSPLPECNGVLAPGTPLPAIPARPCDAPSYLLPFLPVSMATMNFIYAALVTATLLGFVIINWKENR